MGISTAIAIYFLIWWIVLFAVLPWGVRAQGDGQPAGHRSGRAGGAEAPGQAGLDHGRRDGACGPSARLSMSRAG